MNLSIRSRLALMYAAVFFMVLVFVFASTAFITHQEIDEEVHELLRDERRWVLAMLGKDYRGLLDPNYPNKKSLADAFFVELTERYGYRDQFAIIITNLNGNEQIYTGSGISGVQQFLPPEFLDRNTGFYDLEIDDLFLTVHVKKTEWGSLIIGSQNETFLEVIEQSSVTLPRVLPFIFIVVTLAGWIMARLVMRPVVSTARAAEDITLTNLQQRLPPYKGKDEFGILVATLNGMIARIEMGVTQLQRFTQDAAHELRTPLTILRGELELTYQKVNHSAAVHVSLQKSLDRVIAMSKMVENLMMLAQTDTNSYPVQKNVFRLDEVVKEIYEDFQILAESQSINILLEQCDEVDFYGDKSLIYQLLLNLCDNALKHTAKGQIVLSLKQKKKEIEFIVSDTGIGIPEDQLPYIFERFYRVDKARSDTKRGSGLGLAICQWIVRAHYGKIHIQSQANHGTVVHILLPNTFLPHQLS